MVLGYQRWDDILFAHWKVPVATLRPLVDPRLTIDTFDGDAWVSLTPFTMQGARLRFMPPVPGVSRFLETNLRTYVRHGERSGIWFFSLDAESRIASAVARATFGLPYFPARMSRESGERYAPRTYGLHRAGSSASLHARWRWGAPMVEHRPGSLEHFLVERYCLFSRRAEGSLIRADVRHAKWALVEVELESFEESLSIAGGVPRRGQRLLAQASAGVDVEFVGIEVLDRGELRRPLWRGMRPTA